LARVLILENGFYKVTQFSGSQIIISPTFKELNVTAEHILAAAL
jgi:hypothetical protein